MPRKSQSDALSPTQHCILAVAAGHLDHRLTRPDDIKPPTYRSALQTLRRRGLIVDDPAEKGSGCRAASSILSPAGLARVAPVTSEVQAVALHEPPTVRTPRPSTKLAILVTLLSRPEGAGIDELVTTLGWLPHTTRAAFTGLRKRGFALITLRATGAPTRYRIAAEQRKANAAAATAAETSTEISIEEAGR